MIFPAYRAAATLPTVLEALRPQITENVEVILVESGGSESAHRFEREYPWLRVLALTERSLPGEARNLGAAAAAGSRLIFLDADADAVPGPGWLDALRASAQRSGLPDAAVAGSVGNGTPENLGGTAAYLLEFSELIPQTRGRPRHGVSCNLLVERDAFATAGAFRVGIWPGEDTIITVPRALRGELDFAPEARVEHLNRTNLREMLRHQFRLGLSFARICDEVPYPHAIFSRWPLLVLAPVLRPAALLRRTRAAPPGFRPTIKIAPLLVAGLLAWEAGLVQARSC